MGARRAALYALGALVAAGFGVALWSASEVAHACDPTTGQGCPTTPTTQPLPGSENGPPAAQGPSVGRPNNQVQPGSDNGGAFIPPGAAPVPTTAPSPPPATVAPATPTPAPTQSPSSSGGPNWGAVGAGTGLVVVGGGLIARAVVKKWRGVSPDRPPDYRQLGEDWTSMITDFREDPAKPTPTTGLGIVETNEEGGAGPPKE